MNDNERTAKFARALHWGGPTHAVSDVVRLIEERQAQLWERGDGTIVTELQTFPLMKTVNYWLVSGVLRDCLELQDEIDAWAMSQGCTVAIATGRCGWARAASASGWRQIGYAYRKPLGGAGV